uniref:Uncharacterized protein n=1 Tax=Caenorhabditis japonica TaxID=281687 RepID=A0A8R1HSU2_CAEJA
MSSDPPLSNSDEVLTSEEEDDAESSKSPHKLFLLGYIPHARHNPTLKTITNDLLSQYYISWNTSKWVNSNGEPSRSRSTIVNADALIFFINEQTLRDTNCLLTLQYAWNLSLPILMLRPPMTKLVISNRDSLRDGEKIEQIGDGAIMRGGEPWQLLSDSSLDVIDFKLLQDILYEVCFSRSFSQFTQHHPFSGIPPLNPLRLVCPLQINVPNSSKTRLHFFPAQLFDKWRLLFFLAAPFLFVAVQQLVCPSHRRQHIPTEDVVKTERWRRKCETALQMRCA